jgi:two-component sensor histidine kinase
MPDHKAATRERALAELGDVALHSEDLTEILTGACRIVGREFGTDLAKVLEIQPAGNMLLVRAGVGWRSGVVGETLLEMSDDTSEAYAVKLGAPVVVEDIARETRFRFPDFLAEHDVVAMANVPILGVAGRAPYGLLQVDSRDARIFSKANVEFLRAFAAILSPVIDRLQRLDELATAAADKARLLAELQHRITNNLAVIRSLVNRQAARTQSHEARAELRAIGDRVETIRVIHARLYAAGEIDRVDLGAYLTELADGLVELHAGALGNVGLQIEVEPAIISPDVAVPLGLIVNEFITNSLKHAFTDKHGMVGIQLKVADRHARLRLYDNGNGLPEAPRRGVSRSGTGIELIDGLAGQIGAQTLWSSHAGTALIIDFPLG